MPASIHLRRCNQTAVMVLGPEAGFRLAVSEKIAAQLVVTSLEGFETWVTPEFQRYVIR